MVWEEMHQLVTSQTEVECTFSTMQCTLQPMQCTCSIGCSYTADILQTAVYTVPALHVHCIVREPRGGISLPGMYTLHALLWQHFCTLHIHCQQVAVYLQCSCSLHCSYTETILPVHSTSVWAALRTDGWTNTTKQIYISLLHNATQSIKNTFSSTVHMQASRNPSVTSDMSDDF